MFLAHRVRIADPENSGDKIVHAVSLDTGRMM